MESAERHRLDGVGSSSSFTAVSARRYQNHTFSEVLLTKTVVWKIGLSLIKNKFLK